MITFSIDQLPFSLQFLFGWDIPVLLQVQKHTFYLFLAIINLITPILSLMMNFLWLVYRKYEYRNTIIRWTVYILLRTCVVLYLRDKFDWAYMDYKDYSILLHLLSCLIIGCIYIFDFIQFVY